MVHFRRPCPARKPAIVTCAAVAVLITSCSVPGEPPDQCAVPAQNRNVQLASGSWTFLGPEGYDVTAVAQTEWGLYAGTSDHGLFGLDWAAQCWRPLGLDGIEVSAILFVPGDTNRLLVGVRPVGEETTTAAIFASDDQGRTWVPWDGGVAQREEKRAAVFSLAIDQGNGNPVYWGAAGAILRSRDGGRTWEYVFGGPYYMGNGVNAIAVSPQPLGRIWAGGEGAIFNGIVLRSDDWGDTWQAFQPTMNADDAVLALAIEPRNPNRVWVGMLGHVKRSDDAGETWITVLTTHSDVIGLVLLDGTLYAAATTLGLYRTRDGGVSWDTLVVPSDARGARNLVADKHGGLLIPSQAGIWRFVP